ncbi:MAG: 4Fe-4S dicluster domain-containing protein [Desulfobacterales bacterium]|nr:4Fe-4S dicluster domain-containing protein [Desulfobacterales bacterium]
MITFRRAVQIFSLILFLLLLTLAVLSTDTPTPLDLFLLLDPVLIALTAISARILAVAFIPAFLVLLVTLFFGRIFCGYMCPMGTTLDGGDKLFRPQGKKRPQTGKLSLLKYIVLFFLLGASILGVSFVFVAAPLSLITRFYGLLVHPVLAFFSNETLVLIQPLAEWFGMDTLMFMRITTPRFATQLFVLAFFIALFVLARVSPRFWCRNLCPSGALMALVSRKPLIRRFVSDDCTECGKCAHSCPMAAIITDDPHITLHEECIVCRTCQNICPENAISFNGVKVENTYEKKGLSLTRRQFIYSGLAGAATATVGLTGLNSVYGKPGPGQVAPYGLIRPPGALPEMDFLAQCVRCGECMAACPTNTLQPIWLDAGFMGLFSPALNLRRSYCSPECNMCGEVCPTDATRRLSLNERMWAKTGTAVIFRRKCLAWEQQKSCMVCDEVCPYKAVEFIKEPGNRVPVPQVHEEKCAGCGDCEHCCPVQNQSAIVVTPMGGIRMSEGSYVEEGKNQGLNLSIRPKSAYDPRPEGEDWGKGFAPGFEDDNSGGD